MRNKIMKAVNLELKNVVSRAKKVQGKLQEILKKQDWIEEARKYAEKQGKEVKKILSTDSAKLKIFLERERKELERFQGQIPAEVEKLRRFVQNQKKELKVLLSKLRKANQAKKAHRASAKVAKKPRAKKK